MRCSERRHRALGQVCETPMLFIGFLCAGRARAPLSRARAAGNGGGPSRLVESLALRAASLAARGWPPAAVAEPGSLGGITGRAQFLTQRRQVAKAEGER